MNNGINNLLADAWQGNGLYEYLLVGHPDTRVAEMINDEKRRFYAAYGEQIAVKTQPHITVACFLASEPMEPVLLGRLQRIFSAQQAFTVALHNYGGFPAHTIYLRVEDSLPFQQLAAMLKPADDYIRASDCPPVKLVTKPHLTIARKLAPQVYNKAMADYTGKIFQAFFMLDELMLLRRRHQFDACKTIQVFKFRPAGITV